MSPLTPDARTRQADTRLAATGDDGSDGNGPVARIISAKPRTGVASNRLSLGTYTLIEKLGSGSYGVVYRGRHWGTGDEVAIKVMLPQIAVQAQARQRFLAEIELCSSLRHEHIVPLLESGCERDTFYFVMELCDTSVEKLMVERRGPLPLEESCRIALQTLEGLAYAHARGIVHRDLKPGNILLSSAGGRRLAKVSDMGLSKNFERAGLSGFTMTGTTRGTPAFMPREQVTDYKYVKPGSDVWSMGATLYNMITGNLPREFPAKGDPMLVLLRDPVIPVRHRSCAVPEPIAEVIDRSLSDDLGERYQDAADMRGDLLRACARALG